EEVQDGGHRGGVLREFLLRREAEEDDLQPVIGVHRAAQDALVRWPRLPGQVGEQRVARGHGVPLPPSAFPAAPARCQSRPATAPPHAARATQPATAGTGARKGSPITFTRPWVQTVYIPSGNTTDHWPGS